MIFALPLAYLDWKGQGWMITESTIISRRGYLNRVTWLIDRQKIQSVHLYQDPFLRFHNLGQVFICVAGSTIVMPAVDMQQAIENYEKLNQQWMPQNTSSGRRNLSIPLNNPS